MESNEYRICLAVLQCLDNMATSECFMGGEDIDNLYQARERLGALLGLSYNEETLRFTEDNPTEGGNDNER